MSKTTSKPSKKQQKINELLQALQGNTDTLSNLTYGYALAIQSGGESEQIALGIDALLDEVREQFNDVSAMVGGAE